MSKAIKCSDPRSHNVSRNCAAQEAPMMYSGMSALLASSSTMSDVANGITMETGAEGHMMHGGGGGQREAWKYNCDRNGEIECNLITVMYQLADIGPGDGGLVCIPCA